MIIPDTTKKDLVLFFGGSGCEIELENMKTKTTNIKDRIKFIDTDTFDYEFICPIIGENIKHTIIKSKLNTVASRMRNVLTNIQKKDIIVNSIMQTYETRVKPYFDKVFTFIKKNPYNKCYIYSISYGGIYASSIAKLLQDKIPELKTENI